MRRGVAAAGCDCVSRQKKFPSARLSVESSRIFALADCLGAEPERCVLSGFCGLQWIFDEALEAWFRVLDRYTLADVVKRSKDLPRLLGLS